MPTLTSELIARLKDGISGPAAKAGRSLDALVGKANGSAGKAGLIGTIGNGGFEAAKGMIAFGGAAGAAALAVKGFKDYAAFDRTMTRIGITAEATSEEVAGARKQVRDIANQYGLSTDDTIKGLDSLTAAGMNMKDALAFLPSVAATAQASGADVGDMASSAQALSQNLKVNAGDMQRAFDILAAAGKAGKFELKDMAQFMPSIAAAANAVGISGVEGTKKLAAMLQVVRTQTGTSGEAATNLLNVFQKMTSQETVNKFKKMGVKDLRGQLDAARKSGKDVLETFLDITEKATKGDLSKIPLLFNDAQMQAGMRALVGQRDMLRSLTAQLGNVDGTVMKDLAKVQNDAASSSERLYNSWQAMSQSIGRGLDAAGASATLNDVAKSVNDLSDGLDRLSKNVGKDGVIGGVVKSITEGRENLRNTPSHNAKLPLLPDMLQPNTSLWDQENDRLRAKANSKLEDDDDYRRAAHARDVERDRLKRSVAAGSDTPRTHEKAARAEATADAAIADIKRRFDAEVAAAKKSLDARMDQDFKAEHPDFKQPARPSGRQVLGPPMPAKAGVSLPPERPPEITPVVNAEPAKAALKEVSDGLSGISALEATANVKPGGDLQKLKADLRDIVNLMNQINATSLRMPSGGPARGGSHGSYSDTGIK